MGHLVLQEENSEASYSFPKPSQKTRGGHLGEDSHFGQLEEAHRVFLQSQIAFGMTDDWLEPPYLEIPEQLFQIARQNLRRQLDQQNTSRVVEGEDFPCLDLLKQIGL